MYIAHLGCTTKINGCKSCMTPLFVIKRNYELRSSGEQLGNEEVNKLLSTSLREREREREKERERALFSFFISTSVMLTSPSKSCIQRFCRSRHITSQKKRTVLIFVFREVNCSVLVMNMYSDNRWGGKVIRSLCSIHE